MAYNTYTNVWDKRTLNVSEAALKPGPDPQHSDPDPTPEYQQMTPMWVNSAGAPLLPEEIEAATRARSLQTGDGPVDETPQSHFYGRGVGPGLSTIESQDTMAPYHEDDQGSVAANAWVAYPDRDDTAGSPGVDIYFGEPGNGASPETLKFEEEGVGAPYDKGVSRIGRWTRRYRNRTIDMHRYPVDMRPLTPRAAYIAPHQPTIGIEGNQLDSPFDTAATYRAGTMDQFVPQVVRRQPRNWAEPLSTDGTGDEQSTSAQSYGLRTYGL